MAFVPVPDSAMATIKFMSNDGVLAVNRLFCATGSTPTATDLEEIGDAIFQWADANLKYHMNNDWSITGIHVRAMNEAEGIQHDDTNLYPIVGDQGTGVQTPGQVTYTVTLASGLVGRSARGRLYGVALPPPYQNGQRLTDIARTNLQGVYTLLLTGLQTAGHALQIVSFQEGGVKRTTGRPLPVLSVNVRYPLATQRRRLA